MEFTNLVITRKAHHERCDIRRAAQVMNTSMERIREELIRFNKFETDLYVVYPAPDTSIP